MVDGALLAVEVREREGAALDVLRLVSDGAAALRLVETRIQDHSLGRPARETPPTGGQALPEECPVGQLSEAGPGVVHVEGG